MQIEESKFNIKNCNYVILKELSLKEAQEIPSGRGGTHFTLSQLVYDPSVHLNSILKIRGDCLYFTKVAAAKNSK